MFRCLLVVLGLALCVGLMSVWFIYNVIWGFGGLYTVYYLPTPDNVLDAAIAAPGGDFTMEKRNAVYRVQQPFGDLVNSYRRDLLLSGWTILDEGAVRMLAGGRGYCFVVEQRSVQADIKVVGAVEDSVAAVYIHFDDPSFCGAELHR